MKKLNKQQYRTLKDLTKVEETKLTTITIETKCPKVTRIECTSSAP